jgi:hypothetical protein
MLYLLDFGIIIDVLNGKRGRLELIQKLLHQGGILASGFDRRQQKRRKEFSRHIAAILPRFLPAPGSANRRISCAFVFRCCLNSGFRVP